MIPRPEHPNPQFQRESWKNLNGQWEFELDPGASGRERKRYEGPLEQSITVPFCPESKLSGMGHLDFMPAVWYRREVELPEFEEGKRVILHFGAVDYEASVYVNNQFAGSHRGGYASFQLDITPFLQGKTFVLAVYAEDDVRHSLHPRGKQCEAYASRGCDYTRTTGIWQTVWLELVPESRVEWVKYDPDPNTGTVRIQAQLVGRGDWRAEVSYRGENMGSSYLPNAGGLIQVTIPLRERHLWEIGQGRLYDVVLTFGEDRVASYFGLRDVRLEGKKFLLNGVSVFQRLVLDQGFYREGIYTAPTDELLERDILLSQALGFQGARLHQKVFEPRFLYHCDRHGYLVWEEYGNWGLDGYQPDAVFAMLPEWLEVMRRDWNHPSIIGWCPFNETWGSPGSQRYQQMIRLVYQVTKELDPSRPCIDTSGWFHVETDIFDVHNYNQNPEEFRRGYDRLKQEGVLQDDFAKQQTYRGEPVMVSEYGGIHWNADDSEGWGYGQSPQNREEFLERYRGLTEALLDNECILGFCYTQLYDIEQELNGLYTYDRVPKFDVETIRQINSRKASIEE